MKKTNTDNIMNGKTLSASQKNEKRGLKIFAKAVGIIVLVFLIAVGSVFGVFMYKEHTSCFLTVENYETVKDDLKYCTEAVLSEVEKYFGELDYSKDTIHIHEWTTITLTKVNGEEKRKDFEFPRELDERLSDVSHVMYENRYWHDGAFYFCDVDIYDNTISFYFGGENSTARVYLVKSLDANGRPKRLNGYRYYKIKDGWYNSARW